MGIITGVLVLDVNIRSTGRIVHLFFVKNQYIINIICPCYIIKVYMFWMQNSDVAIFE